MPRHQHGLSRLYLLGGMGLGVWAYTIAPDLLSVLRFGTVGAVQLPTRYALLACSGVGLITGIWGMIAAPASRLHTVRLGLNAGGLVCSILIWASMGQRLEVLGLLAQSFRLATPIALGALAGLLCERCGVVNIGIEGMMLSAACLGFIVALYTSNTWIGLGMAVLVGCVMAAVHAILAIHGGVDQIISSTVLNIFAVGITGFLRRAVLLQNPRGAPAVFSTWPIPFVSDIPVLGQIFFRHQPLVYTTWLLVGVVHVLLFYTTWGLRTRAVGEYPRAADTLGIDVYTVRYGNVIASGILAGLAGAWFSLETVGTFDDMMTGGKGFIALAAMIFGKWKPCGAFGGALLFGFVDALQIKLQIVGVNVPYQLLGMMPYVVTMVVLAGFIGRAVPPAAVGQPYEREG
ncbi:MAG TPA: ABC transporter permease [Candidatus Tectomicrobia bacterium]